MKGPQLVTSYSPTTIMFVNTNANLIVDPLKFKSPPQSKPKKLLKVTPSLSLEQGCYFVNE